MPEMAEAGEHHGDAGLVCGGDNLAVAERTRLLRHSKIIKPLTFFYL
jgi:hypothetical protein